MKSDGDIKSVIAKHLENYPDAARFLAAYGVLVHAVDDLIDRDNSRIENYTTHALDCFGLAIDLFSTKFYRDNIGVLYPIAKHIHRVYAASVAWENALEPWKAQYADVLRCFGHDMIIAVLEHVARVPYEEVRRIDLALREDSWKKQHDEKGQPT